ncbi:MAG: hypothetical protein WD317_02460 [Balneolaceae bacterium]
MTRQRSELRDAVKQDRQISQYATLLTVYHWIYPDYRRKLSTIERELREMSESED